MTSRPGLVPQRFPDVEEAVYPDVDDIVHQRLVEARRKRRMWEHIVIRAAHRARRWAEQEALCEQQLDTAFRDR